MAAHAHNQTHAHMFDMDSHSKLGECVTITQGFAADLITVCI